MKPTSSSEPQTPRGRRRERRKVRPSDTQRTKATVETRASDQTGAEPVKHLSYTWNVFGGVVASARLCSENFDATFEGLRSAVLPRTARLDEERLDAVVEKQKAFGIMYCRADREVAR